MLYNYINNSALLFNSSESELMKVVQLNISALLFNSSESELMKVVQLNISALLFNSSESELMNIGTNKQFRFVIQLF